MNLVFYWYYCLPVVLVVLYGGILYYVVPPRSLPAWKLRLDLSFILLAEGVLVAAWLSKGFPLPVFYALTYLIQAAAICIRRNVQIRYWFFINLNFVNMMVLHMTFTGVASLIRKAAMHTLLADAVWRTASVAFVLTACIIENVILLYKRNILFLLVIEAKSDEARPFMAFLSFCTGYLLLDSLLCEAELMSVYPALFLLGSSTVLAFCIIRFLIRIRTIMHEEYLRKEHDELSARLESARESTGSLKRMTERDALTGTFSRRYLIDYIDKLIEEDQLFSLAFLDLDGLKLLNDREGHDAGDRYLIMFSREIETRLGSGGLLARVGGDEFIVLMPDTEAEAAESRMESIRETLESGYWERPMRFSYGVTAYLPGGSKKADALLREADRAMYRDKIYRR
ncbi:GGDEF domain-containing protein [Lachnospiraceae bacterium]|uniref:GGDEF domain-containing protein n=1 Tax=Extibacter sp. GGCC_0201 TaxID=2731209 RepID=UPI001AA159C3|nr:GGDEF domain-containing protein [Extibacter sp. GGCC_0201]MBO1722174.1 GGDEF domain-containing protein [Extibacter sp. GGCC_0201]BDF32124.1 GGDEF domain-containing protein [Lachnospiraceae bacterium]BDF36136.1 GGDEF domain-containing protein [Lachnospiraceae bacterium]